MSTKRFEVSDEVIQATSTALHRLFWSLRLDQLGTWSTILNNLAQLDLHILKLIAEQPNIILKEICEVLNIPSSTLTSAINRLEKKGLLQRIISKRDRRSYELELTEKGWTVKQEHDRVDRLITNKMLDCFEDEQELTTFVELLGQVCAKLD